MHHSADVSTSKMVIQSWLKFASSGTSMAVQCHIYSAIQIVSYHWYFWLCIYMDIRSFAFTLYISVEWKKNVEFRKITMTESCLMVGTLKPMKNFKKILVSSAPNRGPKFQKKYDFFDKNACFLVLIFYLQLSDCCGMYRWKELFKLTKMTYYLSIYLDIW